MQQRFDFVSSDLERWRLALRPLLKGVVLLPRQRPIDALIKSLISGRTRDAVSGEAYRRVRRIFPLPERLARATPQAIERAIADVTFPEVKASQLSQAMRQIAHERPDFDLDFLGSLPVPRALAWLERLPGVGPKVAAAVLNASLLSRPVLIVDTHVLRVLQRLGFVASNANVCTTSERVTAAVPCWSADDFLLFHVAAKRLGQLFCRPTKPDCRHCPLAFDCPSRKHLAN